MTQMTYGNGDYVTYSYDKFGNVVARNSYTNINNTNQLTASYRAYADNTGVITRAQDLTNHLEYNSTYDSIGRLISSTVTDMSTNKFKSAYEYSFDQNNNVTKYAVLTGNGENTTSYTYMKDNLPETATFENGKTLTNAYDKLGRLKSTGLNTTAPINTSYTYLASGFEGGYTTNFVETETNGDFSYKYEYDANGNITKIYRKDSNDNYVLSEEYTYDVLGELTQVDYLGINLRYKYIYDSGGNIKEEQKYNLNNGTETFISKNEYKYAPETDQNNSWGDLLTKYNNDDITYDAIGNPLSYRNGISFTWQNGRQLNSFSNGTASVSYTYDSSGTRLKKVVNNVTYTYLYNGSQLLQETIGDQILDYNYDANGQIYMVRYRTNANDEGTYYYYAHNTRGDIVGLYNADGTLHAKYTYDVWGNKLSVTNASGADITSSTDIANLQPFRYRGYYYDYESGFYYLQSRYYDSVTHRFLNADNISDIQAGVLGYNLFMYAANNPVNNSDLTGHGIFKSILKKIIKKVVKVLKPVKEIAKIVYKKYAVTSASSISISAACGPYGSLSYGQIADTEGNIGLFYSYGFGGGTPSASLSGSCYMSNAPKLEDLAGWSYNIGASGSYYIVNGGAEYNLFKSNRDGNYYHQGGLSVGVGVSALSFDAHAGLENTCFIKGTQFNAFDTFDILYYYVMNW